MAEMPARRSATLEAIFAVYERDQNRTERPYLGMSAMGSDCDRELWFDFRKASPPENLTGRKLRLFETGHREEARMIADLQAAGVDVQERDPETGEQWSMTAIAGHFRGHADGRATGVIEAPKARHVVECKTHNAKSFASLRKDGVEKSKPAHWRQMQLYMHHLGDERALYIAHGKDADDLYIERVRYDAVAALALVARAEGIITAARPPGRLSEDPEFYLCRWCNHAPICHHGEFARRGCRTCLHATPELDGDGRWRCELHGHDLTFDEQIAGCPAHLFIPDLVAGEQIDFDEASMVVTYRLGDGSLWFDGRATDA